MTVRFLADANLDQKIVAGLLLREPRIDFELPQRVIPDGMQDPQVLDLASMLDRILVTHDVRTMPAHFSGFIASQQSSGLILVPRKMAIRDVIEDLLLIWQISDSGEWINQMRRLPL